jgi:hypothetical protein
MTAIVGKDSRNIGQQQRRSRTRNFAALCARC